MQLHVSLHACALCFESNTRSMAKRSNCTFLQRFRSDSGVWIDTYHGPKTRVPCARTPHSRGGLRHLVEFIAEDVLHRRARHPVLIALVRPDGYTRRDTSPVNANVTRDLNG